MITKPIIWSIAGMLLLVFSCKKSPYPAGLVQNELVVLAEITAGQPLKIPVSKSIQVGNGGIISFDKVTTANVIVSPPGGTPITCLLNSSSFYAGDPASVYTSRHAPAYNTRYRLQVQDPVSGTVTAETTIPSRVRIFGFDTSSTFRGGLPVLAVRVSFNDPPDSVNQYVFEALKQLMRVRHLFTYQGKTYNYDTPKGYTLYQMIQGQPGVSLRRDTVATDTLLRLMVYTGDKNTDNAKVSTLDSPFERIFLPDRVFNGRAYTETFYVDKTYFTAASNQGPGRVLLMVKSASPELYNYLFWYEQYKSSIESLPPDQLYSPPGNIKNGLGIFGGSSMRRWVYYFDPLY
ncbi:MAG TPA: DUF4249 family protein [Puia sp.]|nr:DUF4249 family protein [Puia sp.]